MTLSTIKTNGTASINLVASGTVQLVSVKNNTSSFFVTDPTTGLVNGFYPAGSSYTFKRNTFNDGDLIGTVAAVATLDTYFELLQDTVGGSGGAIAVFPADLPAGRVMVGITPTGEVESGSGGGGSGVSSLAGLTGALTLGSLDNSVTITPSGTNINLAAVPAAGVTSLASGDASIVVSSPTGAVNVSAQAAINTAVAARLINEGNWDAGTSYIVNQVVQYNGSSYIALTSSTGVPPNTDPTSWAVLAQAGQNGLNGAAGLSGAPGVAGYNPNALLSGGGLVWSGTGYAYIVSPATYTIDQVQYSSALTTVTLTPADNTFDRIDAIIVDNTGTATKITGTAEDNPSLPSIDPTSQLSLGFVYVTANSSTPGNLTTDDIYHENSEWTASSSANVNVNSTNNPHSGTHCIEYTTTTTNNYAQLLKPAAGTVDLGTRDNLVFWIRSKARWAATRSLSITARVGTKTVGNTIVLKDGAFGFSSSNVSTYQQMVVPLSLFAAAGLAVTNFRFTVSGTGTTIGLYLDDIILQGGITQTSNTASAMNWRGPWSANVSYNPNDVVSNGGMVWLAKVSSINVTPVSGTTWAALSATLRSFQFVLDGGGSVITTGIKGQIYVPYGCTVTGWALTSDQTCNAAVDVLRSTYSAFPTTSSIAGSDKPTLSSVQKNRNLGPLSGWGSTALNAGDELQLNVNSIAAATRLNLTLIVTVP